MQTRQDNSIEFEQYVNGNLLDLNDIEERLRIKLGSYRLTKEVIPSLLAFLNSHPEIKNLNFYGNYLGDDIAIALAANTTLTTLNLTVSNISAKGAKVLATNKTLIKLNLGCNEIGDKGAKAFKKNTTLKVLDLGENGISDAGAKALACNKTLEKLDLNRNEIGSDGAKALARNRTLKSLNISYNYLNDEGVIALAVNPIIKSLDLRKTAMTSLSATRLAANTTLKKLNIGFNVKIGDDGIIALAANRTLRTLAAARILTMTIEGVKALARNTTLKKLILKTNSIKDEGAKLLAANRTLLKLRLDDCLIKDEGAIALAANTTLSELNLGENLFGTAGVNALAANTTLRKLDVEDRGIFISHKDLTFFATNTTLIKLNSHCNSDYSYKYIKDLLDTRIAKNKEIRTRKIELACLLPQHIESDLIPIVASYMGEEGISFKNRQEIQQSIKERDKQSFHTLVQKRQAGNRTQDIEHKSKTSRTSLMLKHK